MYFGLLAKQNRWKEEKESGDVKYRAYAIFLVYQLIFRYIALTCLDNNRDVSVSVVGCYFHFINEKNRLQQVKQPA